MTEDISVQILAQASDNIQKLFDLISRIDERVKVIQERQSKDDQTLDSLSVELSQAKHHLHILERTGAESLNLKLAELEKALIEIDKRLSTVEDTHGRHNERWNRVSGFVVQLIWVILAAYLLTKLHLQAPNIP